MTNLRVGFRIPGGVLPAVDGVSFELRHGETPALVSADAVMFEGSDLMQLDEPAMADLHGARLSMVF